MHNIDTTKLLQHYLNTFDLADIDEDSFFTLNNEARLITTLWYLISTINDHNSTNTNNLITTLTNILTKLNSLSTNVNNFNELADTILNTNVTNTIDVNLTNNKVLVDNLSKLKDLLLTTKLTEDTLNNLVTKLVNSLLSVKVTNLNDLSNILLTFKNTEFRINNLSDLTTIPLTLKDNTTVNVNDVNKVVPKVITENQLTTNGNTSTVDITNYSNVSYVVNVSNLLGIVNLSLSGSLDEVSWYQLPITYTNLIGNIKDNIVTVAMNNVVVLNTNTTSKFIRLTVSGLSLGTRINSKVYLK